MLKNIRKWLFTEESEEFDLDENDEFLEKREEDDYLQVENIKKSLNQNVSSGQQKKEPPLQEVIKPKMTTIDIKVDEPIKKVEEPMKKPRLVRKDDFEIPQVISPYFGVKDEEHKQEHNPTLNKITSDSKKEAFNNVISPFYGKTQRHNEVEEKEEIFTTYNEPLSFNKEVDDYDYNEENNIALDEIIANHDNEEDDLIQFSLFGDSKKIQEDTFENEEVEEDNDSLPF